MVYVPFAIVFEIEGQYSMLESVVLDIVIATELLPVRIYVAFVFKAVVLADAQPVVPLISNPGFVILFNT